jgi:hypothetical protein
MAARFMDCQATRRGVLRLGSLGLLGVSLPRLLQARHSDEGLTPKADSCILIFLDGGPSHLDMWDPKPEAPKEIRGEFKTIPTTVPSVRFGEHLPRMAQWMNRMTVVRSMHHGVNNSHAAAVYCGLTGHDRGELGGGAKPTDHPAIGSVMAKMRPPKTPVVPFVSMPFVTAEGAGGPPQPGFFGGLLGRALDPLFMLRDPSAPGFAMPELGPAPEIGPERMGARRFLAGARLPAIASGSAAEMDAFRTKAFDLLTSPAAQKAFRLEEEPDRVREAYGRNIYGQSVLLARRLIEAGTRVACISWAPDANATWDTHGDNFNKLKGSLLPQLDLAVPALLDDLQMRGMLERTLVVVMGEFGRSPKVNPQAGRDHWNFCYSLCLAGGGMRGGYVHGSSDRFGARPSSQPTSPADIIGTIYQSLGIAHDMELRDKLDRPFALCPWGAPVKELFA